MSNKGFTDTPKEGIWQDLFNVEAYINGLSQFIEQCSTPMTISIQGDWGSGKTSFMNMIKKSLDIKEIPTIWINTWQFSQFNLGDSLPTLFLNKIIEKLSKNNGSIDSKKIKEYVSTVNKVGVKLISSTASLFTGIRLDKATEELLNKFSEIDDAVEAISKLKNEFKDYVDKILKDKDNKRLVIFIDDLDRIHPVKAVELLEILKLFLDVENCVFVLAIDYEVVVQGINKKYDGALYGDKGRTFFDKIIQLPFKIPVSQYNISAFVKDALTNINIQSNDIDSFVKLIRYSVGYNPRSMKRLFNSFMLLRIIQNKENDNKEIYDRTLFAVLCLSMSFEDIYNYIVSIDELDISFFKNISNNEYLEGIFKTKENDNLPIWIKDLKILENKERAYKIWTFMEKFYKAVSEDGEELNGDDFERVLEVLNIASITSVSNNLGRANRYGYNLDDKFVTYSIYSDVVEKNLPNKWVGAEINAYIFDGEEVKINSFTEALISILKKLYQKDSRKFMDIYKNAEEYKLKTLFRGVGKDGILAPEKINLGGETIIIDKKTNNNKKVSDLRYMLEAFGYKKPDELEKSILKLSVKLAHRK